MTIERTLAIPPDIKEAQDLMDGPLTAPQFDKGIEYGNVRYPKAVEYLIGRSPAQLASTIGSSIFELGIPGAMSLEEVEKDMSLGDWKVLVGVNPVALKVSFQYGVSKRSYTNVIVLAHVHLGRQ